MLVLRLIGIVVSFFVIRYLGISVAGYSETTSNIVAGAVVGINVVLLLVSAFLPKPPASADGADKQP